MNTAADRFAERYASALLAYLSGAERGDLTSAGELGRQAAEGGLGAPDVVLAHEQALRSLLRSTPAAGGTGPAPSAAEFLVSALSPLLSAGRAAREADAAFPGQPHTRERLMAEVEAVNRELEGTILELREREADLHRQVREQSALAEMSRTIGASLDIDAVFDEFAGHVEQVLRFDRIDIVAIDSEQGVFTDLYVHDRAKPGWRQGETRPLKNTLIEDIIKVDSGTLVNSAPPPPSTGEPSGRDTFPARFPSMIGVPLLRRNEAIGALLVRASEANAYGEADLALAERIGAQIAGAITNAQLHEESVRRAEEVERRVRLDAQNRELRRVSEERQRFLSAVSHELLTPLTIVRSFVELLIDDPKDNLTAEQREYLDTIGRHTRQMGLMFGDLLDVSRISVGAFKVRKTLFDARLLFEEFERSYTPVVEARQQKLEIDLGSEAMWFHGDRGRILQVMSNLVDNASKYSPEGSRIKVRVRPDVGRLAVAVRDEGVGISEENQRKLFMPFSRIEDGVAGTVAGSGLGLVIAKAIVELHDGRIWMDSDVGVGTIVHFHIRALLPADGEGDLRGQGPDERAESPAAARGRI